MHCEEKPVMFWRFERTSWAVVRVVKKRSAHRAMGIDVIMVTM